MFLKNNYYCIDTVNRYIRIGEVGLCPFLKHLGYIEENHLDRPGMNMKALFFNKQGGHLTPAGVTYILDKYFERAKKNNPDLFPEKFSPHCMRHTKAMHLLQGGINLVYIRDILGHVQNSTTEVYARADSKQKREALEKGILKCAASSYQYCFLG